MFNTPFVFLSKQAVEFFEKPYFDGNEWHNLSLKTGEQLVFLSETRAAMMSVPINQEEEPSAYVYSVYGRGEECYIPVYDRTKNVDINKLYPNEVVFN